MIDSKNPIFFFNPFLTERYELQCAHRRKREQADSYKLQSDMDRRLTEMETAIHIN